MGNFFFFFFFFLGGGGGVDSVVIEIVFFLVGPFIDPLYTCKCKSNLPN